ncbi:MAG TPA: DEAD/DEAH box helicase [Gemmatimonadaceae bacterium]|nr:DEAD/DEAH box helicase [Gemmatimonadaceae bacterium]
MTRPVHDRTLPPDHDAFVRAVTPAGRVIVIAPTRAACETIELALGLHIETFLETHFGARVRELARARKGFGIVAGTGSGKTLAIRPIAEELLGTTDLRVGVVNREREATPETPTWNVVIVTTGIARRWFQEGDIGAADTLVVDEIHQTSAELELCLALGKRAGCRFVWLSATVDPAFYKRYLNSDDVLQVYAFDADKAAKVRVLNRRVRDFLDYRTLQQFQRQRRGVALFVPTRRGVEEAAELVAERAPKMNVAFYHGGEPIRVIRPFLDGGERKPFFLAMTAAGQSALNVHGLDTVIIDDTRFANIIDHGRNVLTQLHLGANEMLQMAGRVHGRVAGGHVYILSDQDIDFASLEPTAPEFQLAGDSERVAITCAALGVRADDLELPVPLDRTAYRAAVALLERRGVVEDGRLTAYGRTVEALPVERPWAELIANADDDLMPYLAVMSSVDSLHRMTRMERDLSGLVVAGSDHLTAYNVYAEAFARAGSMGEVYGLPRHVFDEERAERWAEGRGVLVKAVEDAALGMASVYRAVGLPLPSRMPRASEATLAAFQALLARFMPFTLVIDELTAGGDEARVSKTSVCGSMGAIAGDLRYFADRFGVAHAGIEGTQIPAALIRQYATRDEPELSYDARRRQGTLVVVRRVEYFGFELERDVRDVDEFPAGQEGRARELLAEAVARGESRHPAARRNAAAVEGVREAWRRSGGTTPRLGLAELTAHYAGQLASVTSMDGFHRARLEFDPDAFVSAEQRSRLAALPSRAEVRGHAVEIHYDVEDSDTGPLGVARLRIPEKVARTLVAQELPVLDRPLRFVVTRGKRGAVRADSLDELQELLARPFSPDELRAVGRPHGERRGKRGRDRRRADGDAKSGGGRNSGHGGKARRGGKPRRGRRGRSG